MATHVSEDVEKFIVAARARATDENDYQATRDQIVKLIIQITERLEDHKMRKPVLQVITGLPLSSQKQLSGNYHSVLIDLTLEDDCEPVLKEIEELAQGAPLGEAWKVYAAVASIAPDVSHLPAPDTAQQL